MSHDEHVTDVETDIDPADATKREGHGATRPKPATEQLTRGTAVGRYLILDVLGEGGMGVVYAAFDPELDRKVAVKLLQAKRGGGSMGDQAWLVREAQAMARLSHPNVIAVHDVGTLPGDRVFIAMEHVDGITLRGWLKNHKRPWREVLPVMLAAGSGLAAAHAAGLVHRDFKPDNVLIGKDQRVRVMDFGLARLRTDDDSAPVERISDLSIETRSPLSESLTLAGTVVGTPAYVAPELYDGAPADARSDQFSFGIALYEALFWTRPFTKKDRRTKPKIPSDSPVPARIQRVVLRAISLDPSERFRSMDELLAELAVDVVGRRRRALIAGAVVVGLGAAVVGGFKLSSKSDTSRDQLCSGADLRLAGVWDASTKAAVRGAFDATKKPFAAQAFAGLGRALDGYSKEWTTTSVDSCKATRIREEQTEEVMSLRQACLDQRLDELGALTRLLVHADDDLVAQGDKVAYALEPLSRCSDIAALRAPGKPPTEPKDTLAELHKQLADSKAALIAGRQLPSMEAAKKAADLAEAIHYAPYKAEALLVEGAALAGVAKTDEAALVFAEAIYAAFSSDRYDVVAGGAQAAALVAVSQSKLGEARIWVGLARTAIARLPHEEMLRQRQLEVDGLLAGATGDMAAALVADQKALATAEARFGDNSPALWNDVDVIGLTLAKSGAYDKARPYFERALALHEASVGPDHPDLAVILTNLGICYSHAGDEAKARVTYERALAIREKSEGAENPMFILTLNNMADGLMKAGDAKGALISIDRAKQLAEKLLGKKNPLYQAVATTRAEALAAAGQLDQARAEYDDVVTVETATQSAILGPTLSSRATMEIGAKAWAVAVTFEQRAIVAIEAAGGKDAPDLWQPLSGLARAQIELAKPALARPLLERAIAIGEKAQVSAADLEPTRLLLKNLHP